MDSWTTVLYNLTNGSVPIMAVAFCVILIFLGSFFLINLMLAVIMENYVVSETKMRELEDERIQQERNELKAKLQNKKENNESF